MKDIVRRRLHSQLLAGNAAGTPYQSVSHLGAIQAQDYLGALWAVGTRTRGAVESEVEEALAERKIVRCWPMRGTLHFVAAEDMRWMVELLATRVLKRHRARLERDFGLDASTLRRGRGLVERALEGGGALTRPELYALLEKARISTGSSRGLHILFTLAHERVLCFGARRGKQPTFVLVDEWLPAAKPKPRDEALGELARRYFQGHAPATVVDFIWWSGLTKKEATEAIALGGVSLDGSPAVRARAGVQLLPPFDEYTVAYKDRSAVLDPAFAKRVNAGGGMLNAIVVVNGLVAGTWKRVLGKSEVEVAVSLFRAFNAKEMRALEREAARYGEFLSRTVILSEVDGRV